MAVAVPNNTGNSGAQNGQQGGATPGAGVQNPGQGTPANTGTDWTASLNENLKGFVQNKGFKDPGMVVESYQNLEKAIGAPKERLLVLPDRPDAPEWGEVYNRLGRPGKPEEYQLKPAENGDKTYSDWASKTFYEAGLSRKQAEALTAKWNELQQGLGTKFQEESQQRQNEQKASLQKEWGKAFEENMKVAQIGAQRFGLDDNVVGQIAAAIGVDKTMKLFHEIGSKAVEPGYVGGDNSSAVRGPMTPAAAKQRVDALSHDPDWTRRYMAGGANEKAEMERLMQFAYPGETNGRGQ